MEDEDERFYLRVWALEDELAKMRHAWYRIDWFGMATHAERLGEAAQKIAALARRVGERERRDSEQ